MHIGFCLIQQQYLAIAAQDIYRCLAWLAEAASAATPGYVTADRG